MAGTSQGGGRDMKRIERVGTLLDVYKEKKKFSFSFLKSRLRRFSAECEWV